MDFPALKLKISGKFMKKFQKIKEFPIFLAIKFLIYFEQNRAKLRHCLDSMQRGASILLTSYLYIFQFCANPKIMQILMFAHFHSIYYFIFVLL